MKFNSNVNKIANVKKKINLFWTFFFHLLFKMTVLLLSHTISPNNNSHDWFKHFIIILCTHSFRLSWYFFENQSTEFPKWSNEAIILFNIRGNNIKQHRTKKYKCFQQSSNQILRKPRKNASR